MQTGNKKPSPAAVISEPVDFPSRSGLRIAGYWDHEAAGFERYPFVVIAPKYAETKKNNLLLAYMLAANGMNVLRFDHTCHVGASGGTKTAFTLPGSVDDTLGAFDFLEQRFEVTSAALIANSLSARTAVRAAALDRRINFLICLVGVVNVQATLREVFREDVIGDHINGRRWHKVDNILGNDADLDGFFGSAYESGLHDLEGTGRDLAQISVPVVYYSGEDDVWVNIDEVSHVVSQAPRGRVIRLPGSKHEMRENSRVADEAFKDVVTLVIREAWGIASETVPLRQVDRKMLTVQNRLERRGLREILPVTAPENEFWNEYLGKYVMMEHVREYGEYLDTIGNLIGPLHGGEAILDAGCGNGMVGAWLLRRMGVESVVDAPALYVGLDLTPRGLKESMERHTSMLRDHLRGSTGDSAWQFDCLYSRVDFDRGEEKAGSSIIPQFADQAFDVICCSLVLSYLKRPQELMRAFLRLLRPGGRLVVSSLKPHNDISVIYRDFLSGKETVEAAEAARTLLAGVGQIKLKEAQGYYNFFSAEELRELLRTVGFKDLQGFVSLGDQAVIVRGTS